MSQPRVRIAMLGTGYAAEIHSKSLRAVARDSAEWWYASRDGSRASAMASRFGGRGAFGSYEQAIDSREVDAILIALPPSLHREWALRALAAGKHVIVEKPPFMTVNDFDEVTGAAKTANRQLLVAENYFYKPLTAALRRIVEHHDLGSILLVQLNALKRQQTSGWRTDSAMAGGGALFEGGIHWVSLLSNVGLTPVRVRASFAGRAEASTGRASGSERTAVLTIEYAEGAVGTLSYSWDLPALVNGLRMSRIYGTEGVLRFETNGIFGLAAGRRFRFLWPGVSDLAGYRAMMNDFVSAIHANRPPAYTVTLARRDLDLVARAYASASAA
ncbi:MAG TPA: Gfo/Idh/MocA family oxidoreductase [Vicinamibacterales bacterium]|nr:Gfo/Idh/MocA family oxidoreductase [Vicinamibacterales bacterium]